ncbi:MAG: BadF/BadG/BcrA/BcrD ATPase family protein [Chloroflexota bacterium]
MPHYFLGVDIGATKSHALLADEAGRALGFGQAGPGNPDMIGYVELAELLDTIIRQSLTAAEISREQIAGAGFGIAGYDWPSQRQPICQAIQSLGLPAPSELVNDALIGLLAGAAEGWGVCIIAGTSCNCWGWDRRRRVGRMTGLSALFGEAAGSGELVMKAMHAVAADWSRRGPATRLTPAFIEVTGAGSIEDLLEGLSQERYRLSASAAPLVFRVAAAGDPVAQSLIEWAGQELGSMAIGVIRQLEFEALDFEVVLAGSFYNGSSRLIEVIGETISQVAPGARLVRLTAPPVVGGVLLGMERAGFNPAPVREALIRSTNERLQKGNEPFLDEE